MERPARLPSRQDVRDAAAGSEAGEEVTLSIDRGGEKVEVKLVAESASQPTRPKSCRPRRCPTGRRPPTDPRPAMVDVGDSRGQE